MNNNNWLQYLMNGGVEIVFGIFRIFKMDEMDSL